MIGMYDKLTNLNNVISDLSKHSVGTRRSVDPADCTHT